MKRDLILLHGALATASQFDTFQNYLGDSFTCHAITLPGHGHFNQPDTSFSISGFSEFVSNYILNHHLNSPVLFGYSMGGYVGMNMAATQPSLISGLMTLATKFDWNPETASKEAAMLQPNKMAEKIPAFTEQLKAMHGPAKWEQVVMQTAALMTALGSHHLEVPDFNKVLCPVLNVVGDSDKMVNAGYSEVITGWIPSGRFRLLDNTPHPFEKTDLLLLSAILKEFALQTK